MNAGSTRAVDPRAVQSPFAFCASLSGVGMSGFMQIVRVVRRSGGPGGVEEELGGALSDHQRRRVGVGEAIVGITDASAMRKPRNPWTRSSESTTESSGRPIRQVPTVCQAVWPLSRTYSSKESSDTTSAPGRSSVVGGY
jgi:hypothetical protein